jgi:hypothetical protein
MANKPESKPEFLCMAPWTHTYLSPQSERRLCCASREPAQNFKQYIDTESGTGEYHPVKLEEWWNSEHVRSIRRTMMNGDIPDACQVCNHKLLNTDVYRSYFWHMFRHHYDRIWETTDETGHTSMKPVSWDYRFSNLCNFKCRMCGDMLSSSWESEVKRHGLIDVNDPKNEWIQEPVRSKMRRWQTDAAEKEFGAAVESGTVEEIYWVGGEPLMYEQHWNYMQRIIELGYADRVYARYNTNLSRIEYRGLNLWNILGNFRDWQVCASLDGTGEVGEYIRTGLNYNNWLKNFESGVVVIKHQRQLKLDYTITIPGLQEIKNMVNLSKKYNVELLTKVTFAFDPSILLSPMALPRDILNDIIDENLDWLKLNSSKLQQSLVDVLETMKKRPTFEEQWPDIFKKSAVDGKNWLKNLDKIRPGPDIEYILKNDSRILNWWKKINE